MNIASDSICPRCGSSMEWHDADEGIVPGVSLTDQTTFVCSPCWTEEQIDKKFQNYVVPQSEWFTTITEKG